MPVDDRVRALFHELIDLPPEDRLRVLAQRPVGPEIRTEIESLLSFDGEAHEPLTHCIAGAARDLLRETADRRGELCGPYRLVRVLGAGGMGTVYLGERADGEIQQRVAIKLLTASATRPGWQSRFLRERQLLASLNHASIVRVIDAGHTAAGQPFLAMEYVEGTPIDEYASHLPVPQRLALFLQVCEAVAHAHRRLIIHRDLKPSNILVDESGQPKLLDFGIARLLEDAGDATETADRLLTPRYASPEQARGELQTTATDIYSLGAVLYKLLTGKSPNETDSPDLPAPIAPGRQICAPGSLNPSLPRDLDFVLRKCLRYEPEERYRSVDAFARDIQAVLDSRPVEARAGDAWYRTRKFLRRYRAPLAAAALAVASLAIGLYAANRERLVAERRFAQLRNLSVKVFDLDRAIRDLPGSTAARESLVSAALDYLGGLSSNARRDVDLSQEIADGYWRIGRIQGVPVELNLGEPARAEQSLSKAEENIEIVLAARPADRKALYRAGMIAHDRMILAQEARRTADALRYARQCAGRLDAFARQRALTQAERGDLAARYGNIALAYINMHRYAEAIPYAQRTVSIARTLASPVNRLSQGFSLLASALRYEGDLQGALRAIEEARNLAAHAVYANPTARMIDSYGILLRQGYILGEEGAVNLNRAAEAIAAFQGAFDLAEEAARRDPKDAVSRSRVGNSGIALGNVLRHTDPARALAVYNLAITRLAEIPASLPARRDRARALANSAYALELMHRPAEARRRIEEALAILTDKHDPAEPFTLDSHVYVALRAQADYEAAYGDLRRAAGQYEQLLRAVLAEDPSPFHDLRDAPPLDSLYAAAAAAYSRLRDPAAAQRIDERRREIRQYWDRQLPGNTFFPPLDSAAAASR
jgi:tetratricopeptide (TPR) repeat protein/predicted Ser/Thr protein kinase